MRGDFKRSSVSLSAKAACAENVRDLTRHERFELTGQVGLLALNAHVTDDEHKHLTPQHGGGGGGGVYGARRAIPTAALRPPLTPERGRGTTNAYTSCATEPLCDF